MRKVLLAVTLILCKLIQAQPTIQQIAAGENYTQQAYYSLATGESVQIPHDSWDLVFTAMGVADAGIHVNESSELTADEEASTVLLYVSDNDDFDTVTAFDENHTPLLNSEKNWLDGAANVIRDTENAFDHGWGIYDPATQEVLGNKIYIIKLRDSTYRKFKIESLVHPIYTMTYSNLDGSDKQSIEINKEHFTETGLAFFSFHSGEVFQVGNYDLSLARYSTLAVNPGDDTDTLEYIVTGILASPGMEIAEIRDLDPNNVNTETEVTFSENLHVIGHDWKKFSFFEGWLITENLSYIVKTASGELYKLVIFDFEGSTTGVVTFEQTYLQALTEVEDNTTTFKELNLFPNPAQEEVTITYSLAQAQQTVQLEVYNALGQVIWQQTTNGIIGLNAQQLQLSNIPTGTYLLRISTENERISLPFCKTTSN